MADWNKVYERVIGNEGGYANVAGDKGAETYRGVSRRYHPTWKGWVMVDAFKAKNGGTIKWNYHIPSPSLDALVKDFYYREFWLKIKGDQIQNFDIASNFFDMAINSNAGVKIMQRALVKTGYKVAVDNAVGADTIVAINKANPSVLNKLYLEGRKSHYDALVRADPSQQKFYDGWIGRLSHFGYAAAGISSFLLISAAAVAYYFFF